MDSATLVKYLRDSLDIEKRAGADALNGVPAADAAMLCAAENDIVSRVRDEGKRQLDEFERKIEEFGKQREDIAQARRRMQEELDAALAQESRATPGREQALKELEQAQAHLNMFMKENRIHRKARLPDNRFLLFSMIVAIAVVEGIINSFFFSAASDFGLLGGFFQAFFVSGVNIGFAFIGGFFALRQLVHVDPFRKLAGLIGLAFSSAMVLAINLMAAQYRGLLEKGVDRPGDVVMERLLELDFSGALNSINSVLLVLIGLLCAVFAMWKGFRADDPYPGYGDMQRDVDAAQDRLLDIEEESEDIREDLREEQIDRIGGIRSRLEDMRLELRRISDSAASLKRSADEFSGERLSEVAQQLLTHYRDENSRIRASAAPAYFTTYPKPEEFAGATGAARARECSERLDEARAAIERLETSVGELQRAAESAASPRRRTG